MICKEYLNDGKLVRHYSDKGFMLIQNETGNKYSDPIDVVPCRYTYTETLESADETEETLNAEDIELVQNDRSVII